MPDPRTDAPRPDPLDAAVRSLLQRESAGLAVIRCGAVCRRVGVECGLAAGHPVDCPHAAIIRDQHGQIIGSGVTWAWSRDELLAGLTRDAVEHGEYGPPASEVPAADSVIVGPDGRLPYVVIEIGTGKITHVAPDGTRTLINRERLNAVRAAWRVLITALGPFLRETRPPGNTPPSQPAASGAEARTNCPHCPDGHTPADGGSQPWGAYVGPERNGDGRPTTIHVMRSAGAHVAESDARWIWERLNSKGFLTGSSGGSADEIRAAILASVVATQTSGLCSVDGPCESCDCFDTTHELARRTVDDGVMPVVGPLIAELGQMREFAANMQGGYQAASQSADFFRDRLVALLELAERPPDDELVGLVGDRIRAERQRAERAEADGAAARDVWAQAERTAALERGARRQLYDLVCEISGHVAGAVPDETTARWRKVLQVARPARLDEPDPIGAELQQLRNDIEERDAALAELRARLDAVPADLRFAADLVVDSGRQRDAAVAERDEARMWARHGYEIGQRSCTWSDAGVAPAWLTAPDGSDRGEAP